MKRLLRYFLKRTCDVFRGTALEKFGPAIALSAYLTRILKNDVTVIDGHTIFLDESDGLHLSTRGRHEPFYTEVLAKWIKEGDTVVDVGANIGYFSLIAARAVGARGRVYAFEPDPGNFALLKKNITVNNFDNTTPLQMAVSDRTGGALLFQSDDYMWDHRIFDPGEARKTIPVDAVALDDYFRGIKGRIDLIKMDIQGAEGYALRGMRRLFEKNKKLVLVTEFDPSLLRQTGIEPHEFVMSLISQGFKILNIDEQNSQVTGVDVNQLVKRYTPSKKNSTNLLCLNTDLR